MNDTLSLNHRILSKIRTKNYKAFTAKDFIELGNIKTINKNLERMEKSRTIRRIISGVYDIPKYSSVLEEFTAPSIRDVAYALARAFNWKICPSGTSALNYLGLSTQVPAQHIYVSSGPYKKYHIGNRELVFKHTNNRMMFDSSKDTSILIQAIKEIGKGNINIKQKDKIREYLEENSNIMLTREESRNAPAWIYEEIKKIFEV